MSKSNLTVQTVAAIVAGRYDDELDYLTDAIKSRRQHKARIQLYSLRPGDEVRFNNTTRPTYLRGVTAIVAKINGSSATVTLSQGSGRFPAGRPIRVPAVLLEAV